MTDAELRLECLKLAKGSVGMAEMMMHFVKTGQCGYKVEATVHAAYNEAGSEQSTEEFLAALKAGDEREV